MRRAHIGLLQAEPILIEATSDHAVLDEREKANTDMLEAKRQEATQIERETLALSKIAKELLATCQQILAEAKDEVEDEFFRTLPEGQTFDELESDIESEKARLELVHEGNPHALQEFEARQIKIDKLREKVEAAEAKIVEHAASIAEIRELWEPQLDALIQKISEAFSFSFERIGCAGQVDVYKDEDFDQWAVQVQVKFR